MFSQKKPYSAITVAVERLTSEEFEEDEFSGIPDLVEAINLQGTGPQEAARAIRKKLKYGGVKQQLRALTILDGLIQNAGTRFQRQFADEMLLERLRVCGTSELSDPKVRAKCSILFRSWAATYKNVRGLESISTLYKQMPRRKQAVAQPPMKPPGEDNPFGGDDEEDSKPASPAPQASAPGPSAPMHHQAFTLPVEKSKKDKKKEKEQKKKKGKKFDINVERGNVKSCIAEASIASNNLLNSLKLINREREQVSQNEAAVYHVKVCEKLQKKIQAYVYLVDGAPEFLGALLQSNDELGTAILTFRHLDSSIDADSDSEDEMAAQQHAYNMVTANKGKENEVSRDLAGLHIGTSNMPEQRPTPPPRPPVQHEEEEDDNIEEEDENDPFADRNAVVTPKVERSEPVWRDV